VRHNFWRQARRGSSTREVPHHRHLGHKDGRRHRPRWICCPELQDPKMGSSYFALPLGGLGLAPHHRLLTTVRAITVPASPVVMATTSGPYWAWNSREGRSNRLGPGLSRGRPPQMCPLGWPVVKVVCAACEPAGF
jgi:hypothetical protein